jgi:hypothetical protein
VIYIGNRKNYVSEFGPGLSNSGGTLSGFDKSKGEFTMFTKFPLANNLNTRRIMKLDGERYLIVCNEGKSYIINRS